MGRSSALATLRRAGRRAACRAGCPATSPREWDRSPAGRTSRPSAASARRSACGRGRSPVLEGAPVALVRLGKAKGRVERQRELEEDQRDLLPLAPAFEQWQQVAVALDRLVERVLLPCLVAGPQQVPSRLVLVVRTQPVVSEQAQHLGITTCVPLLEPLCRPPMQA